MGTLNRALWQFSNEKQGLLEDGQCRRPGETALGHGRSRNPVRSPQNGLYFHGSPKGAAARLNGAEMRGGIVGGTFPKASNKHPCTQRNRTVHLRHEQSRRVRQGEH